MSGLNVAPCPDCRAQNVLDRSYCWRCGTHLKGHGDTLTPSPASREVFRQMLAEAEVWEGPKQPEVQSIGLIDRLRTRARRAMGRLSPEVQG